MAKAIDDLKLQGRKITSTVLHAAVGNRGSMSTLLRLKNKIEGVQPPSEDSPAAIKSFHEVWALAVTEGRKEQENQVAQLREDLNALATENERLDGLAVDCAHVRATVEAERDSVLAEQKALQANLVKATEETKQVLEKLAEERSVHARALAASREELSAETHKLHAVELEVVQLKANNGTQPPRKPGRPPKQKASEELRSDTGIPG